MFFSALSHSVASTQDFFCLDQDFVRECDIIVTNCKIETIKFLELNPTTEQLYDKMARNFLSVENFDDYINKITTEIMAFVQMISMQQILPGLNGYIHAFNGFLVDLFYILNVYLDRKYLSLSKMLSKSSMPAYRRKILESYWYHDDLKSVHEEIFILWQSFTTKYHLENLVNFIIIYKLIKSYKNARKCLYKMKKDLFVIGYDIKTLKKSLI